MRNSTIKQKLGCLLLDVPRLLPALVLHGQWLRVWNRSDRLKVDNGGVDASEIGPFSSDIYPSMVFPWIGKRLMDKAFGQWPIVFGERGDGIEKPKISFILPHRGTERLPLLNLVIKSILGQSGIPTECIVVEQNDVREVNDLPEGVRYIHLPHSSDNLWRKCWAYNAGAIAAKGEILIFHDADILIPKDYAREVVKIVSKEKVSVVHPQRFLFCLTKEQTLKIDSSSRECLLSGEPERIRQNWKGGTVAIKKEAFFEIGGFDERFVGWAGEDREFYDRCMVLKGWRHGYIPFAHLWHEQQQSKSGSERANNLEQTDRIMRETRKDRITRLRETQHLHPGINLDEYVSLSMNKEMW